MLFNRDIPSTEQRMAVSIHECICIYPIRAAVQICMCVHDIVFFKYPLSMLPKIMLILNTANVFKLKQKPGMEQTRTYIRFESALRDRIKL